MNGIPAFADLMTQFFDIPRTLLTLARDDSGNQRVEVRYSSEGELRAGLAQLARAYGWIVQEEVVVPGWGRIDLVLDDGASAPVFLIELKLALLKPADVRRAFQQADGYGRWWTQTRSRNAVPILSAGESKPELVGPVADIYPSVSYYTVSELMNRFVDLADPRIRLRRMRTHLEAIRTLAEVHEHAECWASAHIEVEDERRSLAGTDPAEVSSA